jgi:hypothetical protein
MRIKQAGYNMKIVRIDNAVSALWSRDLLTLWHGIGRTFAPMTKLQIFTSLITVFFMAMLPFLLLPYALSPDAYTGTSDLNLLFWMVDISSTFQQQELEQLTVLFFYLNVISCLMIVIAVAAKDMKKYRITPVYSLLSFLGAGFIVISYIANIISLLSEQSISWRGRTSKITYSNKV